MNEYICQLCVNAIKEACKTRKKSDFWIYPDNYVINDILYKSDVESTIFTDGSNDYIYTVRSREIDLLPDDYNFSRSRKLLCRVKRRGNTIKVYSNIISRAKNCATLSKIAEYRV